VNPPLPSEGTRSAERPAQPGPASAAWLLMSDFVRSYDPADELRRELGLGRGAGRVRALVSLADGPLSLAELARAIGADASYTTIIVNELQALGLLSRSLDARDRRRKAVELTAAGRDATRKAQEIIARPPAPLADLPAAHLRRLREILGQLTGPAA
jgi:DNA-binding MarR family transcriptional regulator